MGQVLKSKHTQLFIAIGEAEVIKVTRVRSVGFPDGQASEIDISDFDDDWDQFVAGRKPWTLVSATAGELPRSTPALTPGRRAGRSIPCLERCTAG